MRRIFSATHRWLPSFSLQFPVIKMDDFQKVDFKTDFLKLKQEDVFFLVLNNSAEQSEDDQAFRNFWSVIGRLRCSRDCSCGPAQRVGSLCIVRGLGPVGTCLKCSKLRLPCTTKSAGLSSINWRISIFNLEYLYTFSVIA